MAPPRNSRVRWIYQQTDMSGVLGGVAFDVGMRSLSGKCLGCVGQTT
jgi:hypothetical protein